MDDDTPYTHARWIAENPEAKIITGDERALAALRDATRAHHDADDITDDAPIVSWMGGYVKGHGKTMHSMPADAVSTYLVPQDFPLPPIAVWPDDQIDHADDRLSDHAVVASIPNEAPNQTKTNRDELFETSRPAEGTPDGIRAVMTRTRLYHEVDPQTFPEDGDLRWFLNGLHIIGPGDDPVVYQTPMARVEDLIVPRQAPKLPWIRILGAKS